MWGGSREADVAKRIQMNIEAQTKRPTGLKNPKRITLGNIGKEFPGTRDK